jgi:uncharacterized protein YndB with AHSA1/START domain
MTTDQTAERAVRRTITVDASVERAFEVFTDRFGTWWPMDYHSGDQDPQTVVIEPRDGGRWYERAADGTEFDWGVVLAWEPPNRLVLAWRLDAQWKHNPDPMKQTEIEVLFTPDGPGRTRVDLEHRLLERFGGDADEMRATFDSDAGWVGLLKRYADAAAAAFPASTRPR